MVGAGREAEGGGVSTCPTGKIQHATRAAADGAAHSLRAEGSVAVQSYVCPLCSAWHVGTLNPKANLRRVKGIREYRKKRNRKWRERGYA